MSAGFLLDGWLGLDALQDGVEQAARIRAAI
jgi:hypothetical protein